MRPRALPSPRRRPAGDILRIEGLQHLAQLNKKHVSSYFLLENMFVVEFAMQQDRDHICEVSPWHIHKHAVILSDFDECMFLSKLKFDKLQVWARVVNLPFNL